MTHTELRDSTSYLGVLHALETYYSTYICNFYCDKYKTKLQTEKEKKKWKRQVYPGHKEKRNKSLYFYSMELRVANWDQNIRILKCYNNQQFFSVQTVHTQNLHYYLTIGLFIFSVKMVLSWKQLLCHHLLLWISAGDLRERQTLQVLAGRPGMLACYTIC